MASTWRYPHQDLGEPLHVDGSPVLRPVVPLIVAPALPAVLGVIDSGSPVSVANADLFRWLGVDIDVELHPRARSDSHDAPIPWRLELGARRRWRLPFAVLLGQRGRFDRFPTRIDATSSTVEI